MQKREKNLCRKVLAYLNSLDSAFFFKVHGGMYQRSGLPDIIGCHNGQCYGIELKVGSNKTTELQMRTLDQMYEAGVIVGVCYTLEHVKELIEEQKHETLGNER